MKEVRCPICKKLWFYAKGKMNIAIKCPRCRHLTNKVIYIEDTDQQQEAENAQ